MREVREEAGIEVVVERFLGWVERIGEEDEAPFHFVILDFAVTSSLDLRRVTEAGDDAAEAAWVPLHELAELASSNASTTSCVTSRCSPEDHVQDDRHTTDTRIEIRSSPSSPARRRAA